MGNNIAGKVVVITGASSGLGEATARLLSAQGASVALGARRVDRLKSLAGQLTQGSGKAIAVATDVTDSHQVKQLVDKAVHAFGRIDVMINNAGLMPHSPLERLKIDDWNRTIDVNIKGVLYGIAAALPYMKEQKAGHIINVSSARRRGGRPKVLQGDCNSCRLVRAGSRLCDEPAGRGGHKRNPFPAYTPGAVSADSCFS
jgi:NADP-dependent 3-hydroxy acid dehydrogenase YdfG